LQRIITREIVGDQIGVAGTTATSIDLSFRTKLLDNFKGMTGSLDKAVASFHER
jgi:hypothetical protein